MAAEAWITERTEFAREHTEQYLFRAISIVGSWPNFMLHATATEFVLKRMSAPSSPLESILRFLGEIGIVVHERSLPAATFVPGIFVERGELVIDRDKLAYPGDLLHEAGHIAIIPPAQRALLNDDLKSTPAEEMAAIAWSYAAALHLGIDPAVVFHPHGYKGQSQALLDGFRGGSYIGAPMLAWYGLTRERPDGSGAPAYPKMSGWVRAEPAPT